MGQSAATYEQFKLRLKARLADVIAQSPGSANGLRGDREAMKTEMRSALHELLIDTRGPALSTADQERLIDEALEDMVGLGPLDALLNDPTVTEIMVNGPHELFAERSGRLHRIPAAFQGTQQLMFVIERMLSSVGLSVTESNPVCDARLPDGSRMNVIIPPLAINGPIVTIRKKLRDWTMEELISTGALDQRVAQFLEACVKARVNMILAGGTSTGKTTLVSILSEAIPIEERIITIENVSELDLPGERHWIRLVGRSANLEGRGEVPLRVLVNNALRMRPDRIILGEARGGEALDVVQAMHSGHDGFMTVLHANSPHAALERLQTLMLMSGLDVPPAACRAQIASAIDLVVHMSRFVDGSRRIGSITQVLGMSADGFGLEELFRFEVEGFEADGRLRGAHRYTGARPRFAQKFQLNNVALPDWMHQVEGGQPNA